MASFVPLVEPILVDKAPQTSRRMRGRSLPIKCFRPCLPGQLEAIPSEEVL